MTPKTQAGISFKPKTVTKHLLSVLPTRARDVLMGRYGLGDSSEKLTLEAIGKKYNITRERVRQIEASALETIRKSAVYKEESATFDELKKYIETLGKVVPEIELLELISKDVSMQNHVHFMLVVGEHFEKRKEDDEFIHHWYVDSNLAKQIQQTLKKLYTSLSDDDLIPESELISNFLEELKDLSQEYKQEEIAKRWLTLSKKIGKNPLGEWGIAHSPNVRAKGMRDYAYLAIKRHGSPMHFTEVAGAIDKLFDKRAHVATTHNELIKDPRFVLVGRGLYALKEWGYTAGVVKEVIKEILRKNGPLTRDEIIEKVKKERYVKDNTILVNLQDQSNFKRDKEGKYSVVELAK